MGVPRESKGSFELQRPFKHGLVVYVAFLRGVYLSFLRAFDVAFLRGVETGR